MLYKHIKILKEFCYVMYSYVSLVFSERNLYHKWRRLAIITEKQTSYTWVG